jgi:ADP-heptose:LPS heptosyltransferase
MERVVVWKVNGLGDFVTFLPTLSRIIDHYGLENVLLVLSPVSLEVLKVFYTPVHYEVITRIELRQLYKHPVKLLHFASKVRAFSPNKAYFTYDECSSAYIVSFLAGIRQRIGYATNIAFGQRLLTKRISFTADKNIYDIHADLINDGNFDGGKGIEFKDDLNTPPDFFLQQPYIVIHPFAQFSYREWSFENYCELARQIEGKLGVKTAMIGEQKHKQQFQGYELTYTIDNSIEQIFKLIRNAKLFVGNNSGPLHISIVTETPFVSIEGPSAANWGPKNGKLKYVRLKNERVACVPCESIFKVPMKCNNHGAPNECLSTITVQEVFSHVNQLYETIK